MALTKEQRDALKDTDFAVPEKRLLPLVDKTLVLMAAKNLDSIKGISDEQRETARILIHNKGVDLGLEDKALKHCHFSLSGMAIDIPKLKDHPNRHPFTGIMTRLGVQSDAPVGGTTGKKVIIPVAVAEAAIPTLLGMAIDYKQKFDGHDRRAKIGIITEAFVGAEDTTLGTPLHIAGFFYAADFPSEVDFIQSNAENLGFSYEAAAYVEDLDKDPWVCTSCKFTGAAVLFKDKAAFTRTSIEASKDEGPTMTPEEIKALQDRLAATEAENKRLQAAATLTQQSAASLQHLVKPHADALRACAANMMAAGIGADSSNGHASILGKMADSMEAEAVLGRVPATFHQWMYGSAVKPEDSTKAAEVQAAAIAAALKPLEDQLSSLGTKLADAEQKAKDLAAGQQGANKDLEAKGERKSLHVTSIALLKKMGLDASAEAKLTVQELDTAATKAGLRSEDRMALKLNLRAAGALA